MSAPVRLAAFAVTLVIAFGAAFGVGSAVGPDNHGPDDSHEIDSHEIDSHEIDSHDVDSHDVDSQEEGHP